MSSSGYPDQSVFDAGLYTSLPDLPSGGQLAVAFARRHVTPDAVAVHIPRDGVIKGMQANMFRVAVERPEGRDPVRLIAKRVRPRELPANRSAESWSDFIASVKREIDFYSMILEETDKDIKSIFPRVYYSAGATEE